MGNTALYDKLLEVAQKRRTIRQFKPDPIPDGYIEKVIEVARWAPSGFHTQPWEFIAVTKQDLKHKIIAVLDKHSPPITHPNADTNAPKTSYREAPVFIFALCDWRSHVGLPHKMEPDDPRVAGIFTSSMASAFLLMHLAATSLGLASKWYSASARPPTDQVIKDILGIPKQLKLYDMMVLGYAAQPPIHKGVRDLKAILHYNYCGAADFRTDEQVAAEAAETKAWCLSAH